MLFLFDILPNPGHIRFTLDLAYLLHEVGYEVYYTDTSDSIFTSGLLRKRIGRVIYPGDFRWFTPDLVLLDYQLQTKAAFYRQEGVTFIFVSIQLLGCNEPEGRCAIPIVYLPPSEHTVSPSSPRLGCLLNRLSVQKNESSRIVIASLLEEGADTPKLIPFYNVIKQSTALNTHFITLLLTNNKEVVRQLFPLPDNMYIYRLLDLPTLLPNCDVVLTTGHTDVLIDSIYAHLPTLAYPISSEAEHRRNVIQSVKWGISNYGGEIEQITPERFSQQIADIMHHREAMIEKNKQLCTYFEAGKQDLRKTVEYLIAFIQQNRK